jgi:hypothetical protein
VVKRPSSVDETLLHNTLDLTPDERLARFEAWYADMQQLRDDVIAGRRAAAVS